MNKIDIDVIYGIKPRKYQDGGPVGDNTTPMYSGEGWHASLLIPNFRAPYLQYFINPNDPTKTYVLWSAARDANLPFVADTATSEPGAFFDYSPDTRFGGEIVNPNTTYVAIDPEGRIINTDAASIILDGKDMIPVNDSWAYDPSRGGWWQRPESNQGYINDADEIARRNSLTDLNELFGLAMGAQVPFGENPELLDASMSRSKSLLQNLGTGILGAGAGEVAAAGISRAAPYVPVVGEVMGQFPRTTAAVAGFGAGFGQGYAMGQDEMSHFMKGIGTEFTDENFKELSKKATLHDMLMWLANNGYTITIPNGESKPEISSSYYIHPWENNIFGIDKPIWWDNGLLTLGYGASKLLKVPKKGGWILPTYIIASGVGRTLAFGSDRAKAHMLATYLLQHGYILWKGDNKAYNILTDQNNNPQITDTTTIPQMQDSAASAIPYNEYQGEVYDLNGEQVNPDYVGFETDTASNL